MVDGDACGAWMGYKVIHGGRLEHQRLAAGGAHADYQVVAVSQRFQPHGLVQVKLATSSLVLTTSHTGLSANQAGTAPWRTS